MKKNIIAGLVAVLAVFSSVLVLYLVVARTTSGHRQHEFTETVRFLGERVDSLERQRDLLAEAAASLEQESLGLRKRVQQINAEIQNMRQILGSAKVSSRTALFSWKRFHLTPASGLVIIAFLAFIWILYAASKKEDADEGPAEVTDAASDESPAPGSVMEEEFPARAEEPEEESKTEETPEDPEAPATGEDAEAPAAEDEKKD